MSFASRQWGLGGGCEKRTGEAGEGGVHSEDCRPRRGFLPQGFYPPREDRRGEGVGSNSPRNISPPQDPALPPSWSHHLAPKSRLRTPSLRSVPRFVSPSSGHAILCSQGKWGRGALPLVRYWGVTVSSLGGGLEGKNIFFSPSCRFFLCRAALLCLVLRRLDGARLRVVFNSFFARHWARDWRARKFSPVCLSLSQ